MRKLLSLLSILIIFITCAFTCIACDEKEETLDYSNGYLVKISAVQRKPDDADETFIPETFLIDGKTDFEPFVIEYGEKIGDRLPSLEGLIKENLNNFEDMYWSAKINGEIKKITSDTVFDGANLKVGKGNVIYIQITCVEFFSSWT